MRQNLLIFLMLTTGYWLSFIINNNIIINNINNCQTKCLDRTKYFLSLERILYTGKYITVTSAPQQTPSPMIPLGKQTLLPWLITKDSEVYSMTALSLTVLKASYTHS